MPSGSLDIVRLHSALRTGAGNIYVSNLDLNIDNKADIHGRSVDFYAMCIFNGFLGALRHLQPLWQHLILQSSLRHQWEVGHPGGCLAPKTVFWSYETRRSHGYGFVHYEFEDAAKQASNSVQFSASHVYICSSIPGTVMVCTPSPLW